MPMFKCNIPTYNLEVYSHSARDAPPSILSSTVDGITINVDHWNVGHVQRLDTDFDLLRDCIAAGKVGMPENICALSISKLAACVDGDTILEVMSGEDPSAALFLIERNVVIVLGYTKQRETLSSLHEGQRIGIDKLVVRDDAEPSNGVGRKFSSC